MTNNEYIQQELSLKAKLKVKIATPSDVKKLEWSGQFTHFRNLFRRAYLEQQRGRRLMLVTDFNNYPIARLFIQFSGFTNLTTEKKSRSGYIYSFTVMEPFRNLGIGSRMLTVAEDILRKRDIQVATISVARANFGALKLYKRAGYRIYGEDDGQWQFRDHENNLHQMNEPSFLMKKTLR